MPGKGGRRGKYGKYESSSSRPNMSSLCLPFALILSDLAKKEKKKRKGGPGEERARDALATLLNYRFAPPSVHPSVPDDSRIRNGSLIYPVDLRHGATPRFVSINASLFFLSRDSPTVAALHSSSRSILAREKRERVSRDHGGRDMVSHVTLMPLTHGARATSCVSKRCRANETHLRRDVTSKGISLEGVREHSRSRF